jgi:hypothetical protein
MTWEAIMTVIAMTREMGSRGREVALGLADRLGLKIIHHELVEQDLSERLNLPESAVHRFLEGDVSLFERRMTKDPHFRIDVGCRPPEPAHTMIKVKVCRSYKGRSECSDVPISDKAPASAANDPQRTRVCVAGSVLDIRSATPSFM